MFREREGEHVGGFVDTFCALGDLASRSWCQECYREFILGSQNIIFDFRKRKTAHTGAGFINERESARHVLAFAWAALAWHALNEFTHLDELLDLFAALDHFESMFALHLLRLVAGVVAALAHLLDEPDALDTLRKTADKINRCFALVFGDFCVNCHV